MKKRKVDSGQPHIMEAMTSIEETLSRFEPIIKRISDSAFMSSSVLEREDLYQVGRVAAMKAIQSYDSAFGASLKTHVSRLVRNAIYDEASRFIGPMTVADHIIMSLASSVDKMHKNGLSDKEIASTISKEKLRWECTEEYVLSLRFLYQRRYTEEIPYDRESNDYTTEDAIMSLLNGLETTPLEHSIIYDKWLGDLSQEDIMSRHDISRRQFFTAQKDLKVRLCKILEDYQ